MALTLLALLLSLVAGGLLLRATPAAPWYERMRAFLVPPLLLLCLIEAVVKIIFADHYIWNEMRLARTFGLYNGVPLYPGKDAIGPILGTLHTPLSHILYWPATFASTPIAAMRVAVLTSVLLLLASLVSAHVASKQHATDSGLASDNRLARLRSALAILFALEFFWLGVMNSNVVSCVFVAHADPIALACSTLAGGLLLTLPATGRRLIFSALFAVLAVMAKQTFTALPVALLLFVYLAEGGHSALRYCLYLAGWSVLAVTALVAAFHPARNLLFNLVTLASHRPPLPIVATLPHFTDRPSVMAHSVYHAFAYALRSNSEGHALASFFVVFCVWTYLLLRGQSQGPTRSLRQLIHRNSWVVFLFIGLALFPLLLKASITLGGDQNHIAIANFFLLLALTTSYLQITSSRSTPYREAPALHLVAFVLILLFCYRSIERIKLARSTEPTLTAEAAAFARAHPGVAYFPTSPLSSFYATHRFYTMDHSIEDREIAGHPLSPEQYASGLPTGITLIAVDPEQIRIGEVSEALTRYLSSGWTRTDAPYLPDFVVYRRTAAPPQILNFTYPSENRY